MGHVVVFGSLSQDLTVTVSRHPQPGETVIGGALGYAFGGKGANQAVAAALAGAQTQMVGRIGDDEIGAAYADRLRRFGVDTSGLITDPDAATGTAIIYVDRGGENMIVVAPGANAQVTAEDAERLPLDSDDVLLLQLELPVAAVVAAARRAHDRGARVVLNLAPYFDLPADVLQLADPVVVNETEAAQLAGTGVVPRSLLVTKGAQGASWATQDPASSAASLEVAAEPADVVDTTGAGDSYCGTLAARLAAGDDAKTAMRAASAAAATNVEHAGAQPALPTR